jgi:hypothetical protein
VRRGREREREKEAEQVQYEKMKPLAPTSWLPLKNDGSTCLRANIVTIERSRKQIHDKEYL